MNRRDDMDKREEKRDPAIVVVLNEEDSKEFILSWFEFFANDFSTLECFRKNASETLFAVLDDDLRVRSGGYYDRPPAAKEMLPVYIKMKEKYNSKCIAASPKVWHDMKMDDKVAMLVYAYFL